MSSSKYPFLLHRLAGPGLGRGGRLTTARTRWQMAGGVVEALGLWECDPLSRALLPAQRVQRLLSQGPAARFDGLARRVVEHDARPLIPALRAALRAAGEQAIDEVVLRALLAEQHRDLLFAPWGQVGDRVYPCPPESTPQKFADCAKRGIHAVTIVSAGFREAGAEGAALEQECLTIASAHGVRLLGPNCIGTLDTHLPLDTTFLQPPMPAPGHIGFISHSGAFCAAIIDWARAQG